MAAVYNTWTVGPDNDEYQFQVQAVELSNGIGLEIPDGTLIRLGVDKYGKLVDRVIREVEVDETDKPMLDLFKLTDKDPSPPKFPYMLKVSVRQ